MGRNETRLNDVAGICEDSLIIKADIIKDNAAKMIVDETIQKYGKIDVLVNNASIVKYTSIFDENFMENYDETMNTNLRAVVNITNAAISHLIASKGNIVNISSVASTTVPSPTLSAYCVSKAGLDHFTRALAVEVSAHGVRANTINPGPVRTNILGATSDSVSWDAIGEAATLLKRVSEPEEIADLVVFLASDKAKGITGASFVNDNGSLLRK